MPPESQTNYPAPTVQQCPTNTAPVVLVHGLLGWGPKDKDLVVYPISYWDTAVEPETNTSGLSVLEASVGPVSSQHDRACELYAQIRGRVTDFGDKHSVACGHSRWGTDYTGQALHPEWGLHRPVHLVGHSAGGNTARMLQQLLADDYWGDGTSPDWILSITCISTPLNGSTAAYLFGCRFEDGMFAFRNRLALLMRSTSFADTRTARWKLQHWGIVEDDFSSMSRLAEKLSPILDGTDHLGYDLTLQGCAEANARRLHSWPNTYYLSFVSKCTTAVFRKIIMPWQCSKTMILPVFYQATRNFDNMPTPFNEDDLDWRQNDGVVPVASQRYPLVGDELVFGELSEKWLDLKPGGWYYDYIQQAAGTPDINWDHGDPIALRALPHQMLGGLMHKMQAFVFPNSKRHQSTAECPPSSPSTSPDEPPAEGRRRASSQSISPKISSDMQRAFYEHVFYRLSHMSAPL